MKFSVSIPDELWLKLQILFPDSGKSELVQMALTAMVADMEPTEEQLKELWERIK